MEQEQETPKRKRRTRSEIEAEALEKAKSVQAQVQQLTTLDVLKEMGRMRIDPAEYSDVYCLMKDCIRFKREHNMSDARFIEIMNSYDDRVTNN